MPKYKVRGAKQSVTLDGSTLKVSGTGEGDIHVVGDTVYKICHAGRMIPGGKFTELAVLDHKKIIKPEWLLADSKDRDVGYTMRLVPGNAVPLMQVMSRAYRDREGLTPAKMAVLVAQVKDAIRNGIHSHPGYLQVDGNEMNYMVTEKFDDIYLIDVNSFQTPSYPADAIMASVRDWNCPADASGLPVWSQLTDWYSYAVISFYMFTGIHPFKGFHPSFPNRKTAMVEMMRANKSVLDPQTQYPAGAAYPFESVIPGGKGGAYMKWYEAVFCDGKRLPPPAGFQDVAVFVAKVRQVVGTHNFDITEVGRYDGRVVDCVSRGGNDVVVTTKYVYVNGRKLVLPPGRIRIGFTPSSDPVAVAYDDGRLTATDIESGTPLDFDVPADGVTAYDGTLYAHVGPSIVELSFVQSGDRLAVSQKRVAGVMPKATELFRGVAFQDMFGTRTASVFPSPGNHRQFGIPELAGLRVIDAKFEGNVLMVSAADRNGGRSRFVMRFAADWSGYDVRKVDDVAGESLNFTTLKNGVCVLLTEDERIEIFTNKKDSPDVKSVSDPVIKADMRLYHSGNEVRFAHDDKVYKISLK